jgi:hypothetical protein
LVRNPEEVIVRILAGKFSEKPKIIEKVKERIIEIVKSEKEIVKYIDSIGFLAGLFDVKIEVKPMPIEVDIRKTFLHKWGKEEGLKEGKQEGLKESILRIVRVKFSSSKAKQIKKLLEKIDDIKYLKKIETEAIKAKTWEDFVRSIKNSSENRNSKSK